MNLVFGGAYQGKLEYAQNRWNKGEVFVCSDEKAEIDFSKEIIYGLEAFALACVREGIEAKSYLADNREKLEPLTVICTDLSQGVVPMEPEQRALREMAGRAMIYLASEAQTVTRVFCGLGQDIKP